MAPGDLETTLLAMFATLMLFVWLMIDKSDDDG